MHLSMDTLGIVDDGCLDSYDMAKGAGSSGGGRVHSIDVILGFTKDQDPLLHSVGDENGQKTNLENSQNPEKQVQSDPYGHLPDLGDSAQHSPFHGESFFQKMKLLSFTNKLMLLVLRSATGGFGVLLFKRHSLVFAQCL